MFKNLYQKSKKILIGFALITSLGFLQQQQLLISKNDENIVENINYNIDGFANDFETQNKEEIIKEKNN